MRLSKRRINKKSRRVNRKSYKSRRLKGGSGTKYVQFTPKELLNGLEQTSKELKKSEYTTPILNYKFDEIYDEIIKNTIDKKYKKFFSNMKTKSNGLNDFKKSQILIKYIDVVLSNQSIPLETKDAFFNSLKKFSLPISFIREPYNSRFFKSSASNNNYMFVTSKAYNINNQKPSFTQILKKSIKNLFSSNKYQSKKNKP